MQGASTSGYAFTGREWDAEVGLYYYRSRYYEPNSGRFINEDPIGLLGGTNFFGNVINNPTRFADPFGLCGEQNGYDRAFARMIHNQNEPSKLDQATPQIKQTAHAMGELDTYAQLAGVSIVGGLTTAVVVYAEFANVVVATAWQYATTYAETYAATVDLVTGYLGPSIPLGTTVASQVGTLLSEIKQRYYDPHYQQPPDHWTRLKQR